MQPRIDLDQNATMPLEPEVLSAMARAQRELPGNPSSLHAEGRRARAAVEEARTRLARLIGAEPEEIVFTSGGTEANNLALEGSIGEAGALVVSAIEHPSVLRKARDLEARGHRLHVVPPDSSGVVATGAVLSALDDTPAVELVSVMLANHETGCLQPVGKLGTALGGNCRLHTDAVQALGRIVVDVRRLGVDLATFSSHKIGGPKGVGALWARAGRFPRPVLVGGSQEWGVRAGTENVTGIVGFGVAAEIARRRVESAGARVAARRDRLEERVLAAVPRGVAVGHPEQRLPNTTLIAFPGVEGFALVQLLDLKGIAASTGAACRARSDEVSHVLAAMGVPRPVARGAVRFSLGFHSTDEEIDLAAERIVAAVTEITDGEFVTSTQGWSDDG